MARTSAPLSCGVCHWVVVEDRGWQEPPGLALSARFDCPKGHGAMTGDEARAAEDHAEALRVESRRLELERTGTIRETSGG